MNPSFGACLASLALVPMVGSCTASNNSTPSDATNITAKVSDDIATVVDVRWQTQEPSVGYVEYGLTEALGSHTPLEVAPATDHRRLLLGLNASTDYYYRIVTQRTSSTAASQTLMVRTDPLPNALPQFEQEGDGHDMLTIVPLLGSTQATVVALDPKGAIVWYHIDARGFNVFRARLSRDGTSMIYNATGSPGSSPQDAEQDSELVRVTLDGAETDVLSVPFLAHDFVELPDRTLAAITVEFRDFQGEPLAGNQIVEIDTSGAMRTVWSAWDCFDPANPRDAGDTPELGWTVANALDYDAEDDAYYIGLRGFSSIARIDRQTGTCDWVLGLYGRTLQFAPDSAAFLHQHQFDLRGNRLLVFDNEGSPRNESRVIEYELDLAEGRATEQWTYVADPSIESFVLGEPLRLDDGDIFINWSSGLMERLTPDRKPHWQLSNNVGFIFGFHTLEPSLYAPTQDP